MTTSEPQPNGGEPNRDQQLTLFAEDSPASPSLSPVASARRPTSGGSGPQRRASFATYDPAGCCWRTCRVSLDGEWETYSAGWPRSGMTRNGTAYPLRPSAPLTDVTASLWWPTPQAHDARPGHPERVGRHGTRHGGRDLTDWVAMWPTPTARLGDRQRGAPSRAVAGRRYWTQGRRNLDDAVALWPTPTAQDREGHGYQKHGDGPVSLTLSGAARLSLGREYDRAASGQLNPTWVEWLMGFPSGWTDCGPSETP